jgi:hypothetical protein
MGMSLGFHIIFAALGIGLPTSNSESVREQASN